MLFECVCCGVWCVVRFDVNCDFVVFVDCSGCYVLMCCVLCGGVVCCLRVL